MEERRGYEPRPNRRSAVSVWSLFGRLRDDPAQVRVLFHAGLGR